MAQAQAYKQAINVRNSHYSYELRNNRLRIYPAIPIIGPNRIWFLFSVPKNGYEGDAGDTSIDGINNASTMPFENLPYSSINSLGKQWIRKFCLALTKEVLGQIRGKFNTLQIPNSTITLNHAELLSQAKDEQKTLREELRKILDELTYSKLAETDAAIAENTKKILDKHPLCIFVG
jgi:hypothetical protein